jgi:hypothetical protein
MPDPGSDVRSGEGNSSKTSRENGNRDVLTRG